jgi:hypothetical protein
LGSGGKFREDKIPLGMTVTAYAAAGNLRDAIDRTEKAVTEVSNGSTDPNDWRELAENAERVKSRSITLVSVIRSILKSQEG